MSIWLKLELELDRFLDMGFLWQGNMTEEMVARGDDREMKEEQGIGEKGKRGTGKEGLWIGSEALFIYSQEMQALWESA